MRSVSTAWAFSPEPDRGAASSLAFTPGNCGIDHGPGVEKPLPNPRPVRASRGEGRYRLGGGFIAFVARGRAEVPGARWMADVGGDEADGLEAGTYSWANLSNTWSAAWSKSLSAKNREKSGKQTGKRDLRSSKTPIKQGYFTSVSRKCSTTELTALTGHQPNDLALGPQGQMIVGQQFSF